MNAQPKLTVVERILGVLGFGSWFIGLALVSVLCGCHTAHNVGVKGKGLYTNVNTGTLGMGYFKVTAVPQGEESAYVEYSEDTAWLSPSTKTRYLETNLCGSNAVQHVGAIVEAICNAYIYKATNTVENVK